jgi:hypothetical protein
MKSLRCCLIRVQNSEALIFAYTESGEHAVAGDWKAMVANDLGR